ncbi:unnamed protein product [Urochloa humidicola]
MASEAMVRSEGVQMVDAYTGAMSSLFRKLSALLEDRRRIKRRHRADLLSLWEELNRIHLGMLKYAPMDRELPVDVKRWACVAREMAYNLEDHIDDFMVRMDHKPTAMSSIKLHKLGLLEKFVLQVSKMRKRGSIWDGFEEDMEVLKSLVVGEGQAQAESQPPQHIPAAPSTIEVRIDPRVLDINSDPHEKVGLYDLMYKVIKLLLEEEKELRVVSILGSGGLGKTTLANEVYRKIGPHFERSAWVSISQRPDLAMILKGMLSQLRNFRYQSCDGMEQLLREIRQVLDDKRYLIVIDDIWSTDVWDIMKCCLPKNDCGSRIITTTRTIEVAQSCCHDNGGHTHEMSPLGDLDSRRLFYRRVFDLQDGCPSHLENLSEQILQRCGGVPLAIMSVASLLASKSRTIKDWEDVYRSIGSGLSGNHSIYHMNKLLSLSFHDLPYHLKTCMLYLSIFPEDYNIPREQLIWRWIAEGFIPTRCGYTLEQEGNSYFNELVNRSMIQAVDIQYDGTARGCRVHDMVLELIMSLSVQENFVTILDKNERVFIHYKIRRLSRQSNNVEKEVQQMSRDCLPHIRSFNPFGSIKEVPHLGDFKALRVLDLAACKCIENHHVRNIGQLHQLKYLDLYRTKVTELPDEIGNLKYLETLDLRGCGIGRLPTSIVQMQKLQRLLVNEGVKFPDDIGNMEALEMILSISMSCNSMEVLEELGKLIQMRTLEIIFGKPIDMVDEVRTYTDSLVSSLRKLGHLQYLHIRTERGSLLYSLMDVGLTFQSLHKLIIGYISKLPRWILSLKSLVHLEVKVVTIKNEDLHIIEDLDALLYLKLKLKHASKENLVIGNKGFGHLQEFHFKCWKNGIGPVFQAGAMPQLRKLHLCLGAREATSKHSGVGCSVEHLSGVINLYAEVDCCDSTKEEVETMEASIRRAADEHPNYLTLEIRRRSEAHMVHDESEKDALEKPIRRQNRGFTRIQVTFRLAYLLPNRRNIRMRVAFRVRAAQRKWISTMRDKCTSLLTRN